MSVTYFQWTRETKEVNKCINVCVYEYVFTQKTEDEEGSEKWRLS